MLIEQATEFARCMAAARSKGDLEQLQVIHQACNQFLRTQFPLVQTAVEDMQALQRVLESLQQEYQLAIAFVTLARDEAERQLQGAGRSRTQTNHYLDIARNLGA